MLFALGVLSSSGCSVGISVPDSGVMLGPVYADLVVSISAAGETMSCLGTGGIPVCTTPPTPQQGPCAGNPALGPPDGSSFTIQPLGRLELGFLCSAITAQPYAVDAGTPQQQNDFQIFGSVSGGAAPVVEVSVDGTNYLSVNPWQLNAASPYAFAGFQLQAAMLVEARFVRISEASGQGTIQIDSLEALAGIL